MSRNSLPETIIPNQLAEAEETLSGILSLTQMERLQPSVAKNAAADDIRVALRFAQDDAKRAVIYGKITTILPLVCQRCLGQVDYPINWDFTLSPVLSDREAQNLPEQYEPLLIQGGSANLVELIEEELLLALPLVAMHPETECSVKLPKAKQVEVAKVHPLAELAKLKKSKQ